MKLHSHQIRQNISTTKLILYQQIEISQTPNT